MAAQNAHSSAILRIEFCPPSKKSGFRAQAGAPLKRLGGLSSEFHDGHGRPNATLPHSMVNYGSFRAVSSNRASIPPRRWPRKSARNLGCESKSSLMSTQAANFAQNRLIDLTIYAEPESLPSLGSPSSAACARRLLVRLSRVRRTRPTSLRCRCRCR